VNARTIRLTSAEAGQRLDRYLRKLLRHVPLAAIMKQLRSGRIRVDGNKAPPSLRLEAGMELELRLGAADLERLDAAGDRRSGSAGSTAVDGVGVVYEDEDVLVLSKPAGLAVHSGSGNERRSVVAWLDQDGRGLRSATFAPAPAHRLDRATSGLVAVGLTPPGLTGLTAAFREDRVRKVYVAVVEGVPVEGSGCIEAPLLVVNAASGRDRKVLVDSAGKPARTDYRTLSRGRQCALLQLRLRSGRTHQIRAHLAHLGHPVVGDVRYGRADGRGGRMLLHAAELEFPHPVTGATVRCTAPVPGEFRARVGR